MSAVALLLAGGAGRRLGAGVAKAFVPLAGRPMLTYSLESLATVGRVTRVVVAVPEGLAETALRLAAEAGVGEARVVAGGPSRRESALLALAEVGDADSVVVHDAARPLCRPSLFEVCLNALQDADGAVVCAPVTDTIKKVGPGGFISETHSRAGLWSAQTPQTFRLDVYRRAHEKAVRDGFDATDCSAMVERLGARVRVIPGDPDNIKITAPVDIALAERLLERDPTP
ncbi:MAG TPA: 2-C-methyl-D-erythritol 4-phosphate cytidylyltransferase [Actinomycetota bacterium]|nr:2-C-methyl-D-erythritol 4-phosphate cytidylyltransferase [Actinomycetota bacterium]